MSEETYKIGLTQKECKDVAFLRSGVFAELLLLGVLFVAWYNGDIIDRIVDSEHMNAKLYSVCVGTGVFVRIVRECLARYRTGRWSRMPLHVSGTKGIWILLVPVLLVLPVVGIVSARGHRESYGGIVWKYEILDEEALIGRKRGNLWYSAVPAETAGNITVPERVGGLPVTRIGNRAFFGCRDLKSVKIPENVRSIGLSAFSESGLESVMIPSSVTRVGWWAFENCKNLKMVTMLEGVSEIGNGAFAGCDNLVSVVIPQSMKIIGDDAFLRCNVETVYVVVGEAERVKGLLKGSGAMVESIRFVEGRMGRAL